MPKAELCTHGPHSSVTRSFPHKVDLEFDKRWRDLLKDLSLRFETPLDLNSVVFLVGVQELGQDARVFRKDEKMDLMHIGTCVLLRPFGYYRDRGRDTDGWPHFDKLRELPPLTPKEQERMMKEAVLEYFGR